MSANNINTANIRKYNLEEESYEWTAHITRFVMMEHPAIRQAFVTDKYPEPPQDADDQEKQEFKEEIAEARIHATATIQRSITDECLTELRQTPAWTDAEVQRDPAALFKAATAKMITPHQKRNYHAHRKALEIMIQEASGNVFHTVDRIEVEMQRVKIYNNKVFSSDDLERWYDEFLAGALSPKRFVIFRSDEIRTTETKDLFGVMERVKDWTRRMQNMEKPSDPPSGPTPTTKPVAETNIHSALSSEPNKAPTKENQNKEQACTRCGKRGHSRGSCRGPVWCKKCDNAGKSNCTCSSHSTEAHRGVDSKANLDKKTNESDRRNASKEKQKQDTMRLSFMACESEEDDWNAETDY